MHPVGCANPAKTRTHRVAQTSHGGSRSMRFVTSLLLGMLACEGCVSLTYSRFRPESSGTATKAECADWPPLADLLIGLGLAGAGFAANYLRRPVDGCAAFPQDPNCRSRVVYYVPAMVAGVSMTYGIAAYVACKNRLPAAGLAGWKPSSSASVVPAERRDPALLGAKLYGLGPASSLLLPQTPDGTLGH
jgi:hypothetical protein